MTPLEHLRQLLRQEQREKYPNLPEHAMSINSFDKLPPEKREKKRIEKFLNLTGHYAAIIENKGFRKDNRKTYTDAIGQTKTIGSVEFISSGMRRGIADLKAIIKGVPVDIELKRVYKNGKDRQSEHQKAEQAKVERAGGIYLIVESFEHFYEWLNDYMNGKESRG